MNIHMVWAQGWDQAPPRAIRNSEAWSKVGEVMNWCEKTAVEAGLVPENVLSLAKPPAMKADIILASAQLKFGGMAVGADMVPMNATVIKEALSGAEHHNLGLVVYQSFRDEPYSGGSYFPKESPWTSLVCKQQLDNVRRNGDSKSVSAVTGPFMWRRLMKRHPDVWNRHVRTVPAWLAFTCEPRTRGTFRPAWINPGLTGDWSGTHKDRWQ